jgi:hypothetical protein
MRKGMARKRKRQHGLKPSKSKLSTPAARPTPPSQQKFEQDERRFVFLSKRFWAWFGPVSAVIGLILWLPFYVVKVQIDIAPSSNDPLMPVPSSFSVTNSGVLDAYSAKFICYYGHIQAANVTMTDSASGPHLLANVLHGGQPIDVACPGIVGPIATKSDIQFLISFSPQYTGRWKQSYACARFVIMQNAHGIPQWFRTPPYDCKSFWLRLEERRKKLRKFSSP